MDLTPGLLGPWDTYLQPEISTFREKKKVGGNKLFRLTGPNPFFFFGPLTSMGGDGQTRLLNKKGGLEVSPLDHRTGNFPDLFKRH